MIFSESLLDWFDEHGRKNLPWQKPITPYRVWLSEVMLQQTQVDTVIPYFEKFVNTYPDVASLAAAPIDHVLHLWTGLGYYARARNLHKCAITVCENYEGQFPSDQNELATLPGIGRSTAAAIASIAFEQPTAILDGNVKRVLTRHRAIEGWPGNKKIESQLWEIAEDYMPQTRCRDYTQAIMDLGATLCTRSKPQCLLCPVNHDCIAKQNGNPTDYPSKKPKKAQPVKDTHMLIARHHNDILLEQRPASGIWGGLWSFKEFENRDLLESHCASHYAKAYKKNRTRDARHHSPHIQPLQAQHTPNCVHTRAKTQTDTRQQHNLV